MRKTVTITNASHTNHGMSTPERKGRGRRGIGSKEVIGERIINSSGKFPYRLPRLLPAAEPAGEWWAWFVTA